MAAASRTGASQEMGCRMGMVSIRLGTGPASLESLRMGCLSVDTSNTCFQGKFMLEGSMGGPRVDRDMKYFHRSRSSGRNMRVCTPMMFLVAEVRSQCETHLADMHTKETSRLEK